MDTTSPTKITSETDDKAGRHKIFALELVFIDKNIHKEETFYNGKIMSFDGHPQAAKK